MTARPARAAPSAGAHLPVMQFFVLVVCVSLCTHLWFQVRYTSIGSVVTSWRGFQSAPGNSRARRPGLHSPSASGAQWGAAQPVLDSPTDSGRRPKPPSPAGPAPDAGSERGKKAAPRGERENNGGARAGSPPAAPHPPARQHVSDSASCKPPKPSPEGLPQSEAVLIDKQACTWRFPLNYSWHDAYDGRKDDLTELPAPVCPVKHMHLAAAARACKSLSRLRPSAARPTASALDMWWHVAPADPCVDSNYTSVCQLEDVLAGDLEDAAELERVARERSWAGEIMFTAVNANGLTFVLNWALSLRAQGFEHWIVITDSVELCKALFYSEAHVSCAWTSFMYGHPGFEKFHIPPCDDNGCVTAVHLWFARLHYMARFIGLGLNPIYMDTDFTLQANFYRYFKTPTSPLSQHHLLLQREHGPLNCNNIGFLYCQGCAPGGAAQNVFNETVNRILAALALPSPDDLWLPLLQAGVISKQDITADFKGGKRALWDQHNVNDVIESAVVGVDSRRRQWSFWLSSQAQKRYFADYLPGSGLSTAMPPWPHEWKDMTWAKLVWPEAAAVVARETVATPPPWVLGGWAGTHRMPEWGGVQGHWHARPPAVAHFVGGPDKQKAMRAEGWWHADAEAGAWLVQQALQGRKRTDVKTLAPKGEVLEGEMKEWAAALPSLADARARLAARRFITVAGFQHAAAHVQAFSEDYFRLVWKLVLLGALSRRIAVLPWVDCGSGWITRDSSTRTGTFQGAWRHDWRAGERLMNGVNAFNCSLARSYPTHDRELCCVPWASTHVAPLNLCHTEDGGLAHPQDVHFPVMSDDGEEAAAAENDTVVVDAPAFSQASASVADANSTSAGDEPSRVAMAVLRQHDAPRVLHIDLRDADHLPKLPLHSLPQEQQAVMTALLSKCGMWAQFVNSHKDWIG